MTNEIKESNTFQGNRNKGILAFLKTWTLPIAMLTGGIGYFVYASIPALAPTHEAAMRVVAILQPTLLFAMLFLTFCKVKPQELRLSPWQGWLLLLQVISFLLLVLLTLCIPHVHWKIVVECAMLCMICPTATAASVATRKMGGNVGTLMTYTILINLAVAILLPALLPFIHATEGQTFATSFLRIVGRIFPLLLGPFLLSILLRWYAPDITERLSTYRDLPFYLWAVSLSMAIAVSVRSIVHSQLPYTYLFAIAIVSLLACIIQFACGRKVGRRYDDIVSATQSCGQKNTVFIIWVGYTFLSPVTSIAGGFYSIWHNLYNSWQLKKVKG